METLNHYFSDVCSNIGIKTEPPNTTELHILNNFLNQADKSNETLGWKFVDSCTVLKLVTGLSSSKTPDVYGLSNFTLKYNADVILLPLTHLINLVLCTGIFPDCLKMSKITPVFKKGNKILPESYRPIALVPILSEIIESCLFTQMYDFFVKHNLLYEHQYGFRPKLSTTLTVEKVIDNILDAFEQKQTKGA